MKKRRISNNSGLRSYIIGVALGDGNLSNPNGRATRLRITCDKKYLKLAYHIKTSLERLLPENKTSFVDRKKNYLDISCYSNYWERMLGWEVGKGRKIEQAISVPRWIKKDRRYIKNCLRGLLQTDGSIYNDRGYAMVNFVNHSKNLARDVASMITTLGYKPNTQELKTKSGIKYTVRVSKNTNKFIKEIKLWKA